MIIKSDKVTWRQIYIGFVCTLITSIVFLIDGIALVPALTSKNNY